MHCATCLICHSTRTFISAIGLVVMANNITEHSTWKEEQAWTNLERLQDGRQTRAMSSHQCPLLSHLFFCPLDGLCGRDREARPIPFESFGHWKSRSTNARFVPRYQISDDDAWLLKCPIWEDLIKTYWRCRDEISKESAYSKQNLQDNKLVSHVPL